MIFAITSDTDFVGDDILKTAYSALANIPCTFFITNNSDYVSTGATKNSLWEIEPHPNFNRGSSHGESISNVFDAIDKLPVEKIGYRCHRYFSSNDITERFAALGYKYSSNICANLSCVSPFKTRCGTVEFPVFFEDGGFLKYHGTPDFAAISRRIHDPDGIYVFNFHPLHIALNSCDFRTSRELKDSVTLEKYGALTTDDISEKRNRNNYGISDFLNDLIGFAISKNIRMATLRQLYEEYKTIGF